MTILNYVKEMALTMACLLPVWAAVRLAWLKGTSRLLLWKREVPLALLVLYLGALAGQTVLPQLRWTGHRLEVAPWGWGGCNYVPFATIRQMFREVHHPVYAAVNLLGNVLVFSPLGLFSPMVWKGMARFVPCLLFGAGCSLVIEVLQPLVGRNQDIDDIILNALGCALGYLVWWTIRRMRKRYD